MENNEPLYPPSYGLDNTTTVMNWITMTRKSSNICTRHTGTLDSCFHFIRSHHDLPHWRSNQQPQNAEPKLYHWHISPHCTQVTPNQLARVIVWPINLNVSCKLHLYSLQRTWLLPGPYLPMFPYVARKCCQIFWLW